MRKLMNLRSVLSRKSAIVVAGGAAVVALSATAAFAYWTTTGSGSGSATAGDSKTVTIVQTTTVSGLVPGGVAQPIDFKINNSLGTPQFVHAVTVKVDSVDKAGCKIADFTVVQPNLIDKDLAAGDTTVSPSGASIKLEDTAENQDACKGAAVALTFTSN